MAIENEESLQEGLEINESPSTSFKSPVDLSNNIISEQEIFTPNDNAQVEKYAKHYNVDIDSLRKDIETNALKRISGGASVTNAKNEALEELLNQVANGKYKATISKPTKNKIKDQVDDGVTEEDIGYLRNVLNDIPELVNLSNEQLRKIISSIRNKKK